MDDHYSATLESSEYFEPNPAIAYASLVRRVAAVDAILRSGENQVKATSMIREEISGAMQVILEYEAAYAIIRSTSEGD